MKRVDLPNAIAHGTFYSHMDSKHDKKPRPLKDSSKHGKAKK